MISTALGTLIRTMDTAICDVDNAIFNEIQVVCCRLSVAHPGKLVEFYYRPYETGDAWALFVGRADYVDAHLESCLRMAKACSGPVAIPHLRVQFENGKLLKCKRFPREGQSRDVPSPKEDS